MKKIMLNRIYVILIAVVVLAFVGCTDQGTESQTGVTEPSIEVGVIDCGISRTSATSGLMTLDEMNFEEDAAMVCIGTNVLDNCKKAKAIVESNTGALMSYEVLGLKGKDCILRVEHVGGTPLSKEEKRFEGTYAECPMDIEELRSDYKRDVSEVPGLFAAELHILIGFDSMLNKDTKCTGTLIDVVRTMRAEMKK